MQVHRVTHVLWTQSRRALALALQSNVFAVDIHSDATIGKGIQLDHAMGVVIGEITVVGNNISILHHVTLGDTVSNRHPKIEDYVLIGSVRISKHPGPCTRPWVGRTCS